MNASIKVTHNLRILGLPPGATALEVRSAFRRLARTCHPDVAGRQGARKFEQIAGAYTYLKNLTQEELRQNLSAVDAKPAARQKTPLWNWMKWKNPISWHNDRQERARAEEEQRRRAAQEVEEKNKKAIEARLDAILSRGEREIGLLLDRVEREARKGNVQDLLLRLASDICEVRHLALSRLGSLANRHEVFDALLVLLQKRGIDEKTARVLSLLPLDAENHRRLANSLPEGAASMPDFLLSHLLCLRDVLASDRELLERYVLNASPSGVALILRHWPRDAFLSAPTLRALLSREDEAVLVPLLGMIKQRAIPCPFWTHGRLKELLSHPGVAVRVWAKALLTKDGRCGRLL